MARVGNREEAYMVLVVGSKESKPIVRPRRRWEDTIKMDLQELK